MTHMANDESTIASLLMLTCSVENLRQQPCRADGTCDAPQSQLNGPIQVVGNAAQQGLLDLLPVPTGRDRPTKPALDHREQRLNVPALAIELPGKGQLQVAAIGVRGHATRWPSRHRWNDALDAQVFAPPAVIGLRIVAPISQQAREGQSGQRLCHQRAKCHMVPARSTVGDLPTQHQGVGPHATDHFSQVRAG